LAAAVALCSLAGLSFFLYSSAGQEFSTRVGEQRTIELLDASVVHLNADSQIRVQFDESGRSVRLLHGEALFKVAHDAARPFRVLTNTATIQVLGTQFNVYEQAEGTRVSVLEGKVRISVPAGDAKILTAGEEVLIAHAGAIQKNDQPEVERAVAWRQRRLVFDNAPLEDMVREFNRYNATARIELQGVAPGSHHYDGIFDADDPASLAELLRREKDLAVEMRDRKILIRSRAVQSN
jgi:transmembrane sensor